MLHPHLGTGNLLASEATVEMPCLTTKAAILAHLQFLGTGREAKGPERAVREIGTHLMIGTTHSQAEKDGKEMTGAVWQSTASPHSLRHHDLQSFTPHLS